MRAAPTKRAGMPRDALVIATSTHLDAWPGFGETAGSRQPAACRADLFSYELKAGDGAPGAGACVTELAAERPPHRHDRYRRNPPIRFAMRRWLRLGAKQRRGRPPIARAADEPAAAASLGRRSCGGLSQTRELGRRGRTPVRTTPSATTGDRVASSRGGIRPRPGRCSLGICPCRVASGL
jgi:hypothetical protein